ncbi:MAG: winged helix-turn-helix domain-containing protein [Thiolinea sp.]
MDTQNPDQSIEKQSIIELKSIRIDLHRGEITDQHSGQRTSLRPQSERLLLVLAQQSGTVVAKDELMNQIWPNTVVTEDSIVQAVGDIRKILHDHNHQIVRTIRGQGYRFVPPTTATIRPAAQDNARLLSQPIHVNKRYGWGAIVLVVLAIFAFFNLRPSLSQPETTVKKSSGELADFAVLPFKGDDTEGMGTWLAEDIVRGLARHRHLRVVSTYSSFSLARSKQSLSAAQWQTALQVRFLIDGKYHRVNDSLSLNIQLTDLNKDEVVWTEAYQTENARIFDLQNTIISAMVGRVISSAKQDERQFALRAKEPSTLAVYETTQRAIALKHQFSQPATQEAQQILSQLLAQQDDYAPAWGALCWINALDGIFKLTGNWNPQNADEVTGQCQRALQLDPSDPLTYLALADAYVLSGDFQQAAEAAEQATLLAPSDAEAWLLFGLHQLPVKPAAEALQAVERANQLFPIKPPHVHMITAQAAWAAGKLALAREHAQDCLQAAPYLTLCQVVEVLVARETGEVGQLPAMLAKLSAQTDTPPPAVICSRFLGETARHEQCLEYLAPL